MHVRKRGKIVLHQKCTKLGAFFAERWRGRYGGLCANVSNGVGRLGVAGHGFLRDAIRPDRFLPDVCLGWAPVATALGTVAVPAATEYPPLLAAARTGDPVALDRLMRMCQPDIRRYARRNCLASDIDDAVQETLLILARRLHALHAVAAFSSWLFRIVQRECRRLERRLFGLDPYDEQKAENWLATWPTEILRMALVQALESLPAHYREVILLRDVEELSIREMALRLALTSAAVKSRLHRARQLMREYLLQGES